jgi:hypothetical protein
MKTCQACKKETPGAKRRNVELNGRRFSLCADCGRIQFLTEKGEKVGGLLQAANPPVRASHKGKVVTFHAEKPLSTGQMLRDPEATGLPVGSFRLPSLFEVASVRPLVSVETVPSPAPKADAEGKTKSQRPRHKRRTVGYSIRVLPA